MEILATVGGWIADNESLFSGAVAIIALLSILGSLAGIAWRKLRHDRADEIEAPQAEPETRITLQQLSAPSPYPARFAESDGLKVAYNVRGSGPPDIVMAPGIISNLNIGAHMPGMRSAPDALSKFARVLCFDKRGQGLSDPCLEVPTLEQRVHDIEAVMDAAGMERAVLYGVSEGGAMCLKFAHDHPDRVKGLVLLGTTATWLQRDDFPIGLPERALDGMIEAWGTGSLRDIFFPGISREVMDDDTYRGFEKMICNRHSIRQLVEYMKKTDVRPLLPNIHCPALVLHFIGDLSVPIRMGRAVAEGLPNATFLEVAGIDHADFTQSGEAVAQVKQFVHSL